MAARKKRTKKRGTKKAVAKKRTTKKRSTAKRTAKQKAATKKLVALNKARARQKKGVRGLGVYGTIGKGRKKSKKVIGDICFRTHEGKLYNVGKVTATCPPGFFHSRTK